MRRERESMAEYIRTTQDMRMQGVAMPVVEVLVSCNCTQYPFPHTHSDRMERIRFKAGQPPIQNEEVL